MSLTLRHLEESDYKYIIAHVNDWWGGRPVAELLPKLFFQHFRPTSFVAEHEGQVVGFLVGFISQTDPAQAYIHFVGVDPSSRGQGAGRLLYERFFEVVKGRGCREVFSITSPVNKGSQAFHLSMGFEILPGDTVEEGVPATSDYDGRGHARVRFRKVLA